MQLEDEQMALQLSAFIRRLLKEFPFYQGMDQETRMEVAEHLGVYQQMDGAVLFRQNDIPDKLYIVLSGEVAVWKMDEAKESALLPKLTRQNVPPSASSEASQAPMAPKAPAKAPAVPPPIYGTSLAVQACAAIAAMLPENALEAEAAPEEGEVTDARRSMIAGPGGVGETPPKRLSVASSVASIGGSRGRRSAVRLSNAMQTSTGLGSVAGAGDIAENEQEVAEDLGTRVATLGAGTIVGEMGLLKGQPRNATIFCVGACAFFTIGRESFEHLVKASMQHAMILEVQDLVVPLLRHLPFFGDLPQRVRAALADKSHFERRGEGELFVRQDGWGSSCYILLAGMVAIHCEGPLSPQIASQRAATLKRKGSISNVVLVKSRKAKQIVALCKRICDKLAERAEREDGLQGQTGSAPVTCKENARGAVALLQGAGELVGDSVLNLTADLPYSFSAVCRGSCEFLVVVRSEYERALLQEKKRTRFKEVTSMTEPLLNESLKRCLALPQAIYGNLTPLLGHSMVSAGTVLYLQEDATERCYIVVRGTVDIWCKDDHSGTMEAQELNRRVCSPPVMALCEAIAGKLREIEGLEQPRRASKCRSSLMSTCTQPLVEVPATASHPEYGSRLASLGLGILLGDHDLLVHKHRGTTARCRDDCVLLTLDNRDLERELQEERRRVRMRQLALAVRRLLLEFNIFRSMDPHVVNKLPEMMNCSSSSAGTVIFEQGDPADLCYVVLSGEVTIWSAGPAEDDIGEAQAVHQAPPLLHVQRQTIFRCTKLELSLLAAAQGKQEVPETPASSPREAKFIRRTSMAFINADATVVALNANDVPIASLGPGAIFGDECIHEEQVRATTAICRKDCHFLKLDRADLAERLRQAAHAEAASKADFLRIYVPTMKPLKDAGVRALLPLFERQVFPLNHVFFGKGMRGDGSLYLIHEGSVEFVVGEDLPCHERGTSHRLGVLQAGSFFVSVSPLEVEHFTVTSTSQPCVVYWISRDKIRELPDNMVRGMRELASRPATWSVARVPSAPARGAAAAAAAAASAATSAETAVAGEAQLVALDVAKPRLGLRRSWIGPAALGGAIGGGGPRRRIAPFDAGRFGRGGHIPEARRAPKDAAPLRLTRRDPSEAPTPEYVDFMILPGELLAMTGRRPMMTRKSQPKTSASHGYLTSSASLPSFAGTAGDAASASSPSRVRAASLASVAGASGASNARGSRPGAYA